MRETNIQELRQYLVSHICELIFYLKITLVKGYSLLSLKWSLLNITIN